MLQHVLRLCSAVALMTFPYPPAQATTGFLHSNSSPVYTWRIRDNQGQVIRELKSEYAAPGNEQLTWHRDYIYANGRLLASAGAGLGLGANGMLAYHTDHLGTPRVIQSDSGDVSEHHYLPFGEEISAWFDQVPLKFTGHERDFDALDYMRARYYKSNFGRFLSVDTQQDGWNRYAYTGNNPINGTDPTGQRVYLVHGTWSNPNSKGRSTWEGVDRAWGDALGDNDVVEFNWSGDNNGEARRIAGRNLANLIELDIKNGIRNISIVSHSHGGNVALVASLELRNRGHQIDDLILIGTPANETLFFTAGDAAKNFVSVYNDEDAVQINGGRSLLTNIVPRGFKLHEVGRAGRVHHFGNGHAFYLNASALGYVKKRAGINLIGRKNAHSEMHNNPGLIYQVGRMLHTLNPHP